jgi:hypothetical protein
VRRILYAWGTAKAEDLQKAADILHTTDSVLVHVTDVIKAFRNGLANYLEEVCADKSRQERIAKGLSIWLINMQPASIIGLLDRYGAISEDSS